MTVPTSAGGRGAGGGAVRADRTWLVALAASLWGLSALFREPLAMHLPALTVVLFEHVVLVLLVSPWVLPALKALVGATTRTKVGILVIGGGSSALATTMFTAAFALGDPITPQVLQKLQPVIALALAAVLLRERLRPQFALFAGPALVGTWLVTFADPATITINSLHAAALAIGAAALWAAGTVLGRLVSAELSFTHVTCLRFTGGLTTLFIIVVVTGAPMTMPLRLMVWLIPLALIPGLLALILYYVGLRATPASRATLAELAFPLTAAIVGVTLLDGSLDGSQWIGLAVLLVSVVLLALHERRSRRPAVATLDRVEDAMRLTAPAAEGRIGAGAG
jgi:drug/metabolite transporter (DMT)-like permease